MKSDNLLLYAVTDRNWLNGSTLYSQVEKALRGGATMIQLREKSMSYEQFKDEAISIQEICKNYNVPFIINDNVKLAKYINADGVHIGQGDMDCKYARSFLGCDKILGVSAQTKEQAVKAEKDGADYIGSGAVFNTSTKDDAETVSYNELQKICSSVSIPVVAIGGITNYNMTQLKGSGINGISVVSAIFAADDIEKATRELLIKSKKLFGENCL